MYSDIELLSVDWILPMYSVCEFLYRIYGVRLPFTVTGHGANLHLIFWVFVLFQKKWRPNFEAFSSMIDRAIGYLSSWPTVRALSAILQFSDGTLNLFDAAGSVLRYVWVRWCVTGEVVKLLAV